MPDHDLLGEPKVRDRRSDARRNHVRLLDAATIAVHRAGVQVPMAVVADQAGVGVGTLYRHFPTRETLLDALTQRSFELVRDNATAAESSGESGLASLDLFLEFAISQRNELVLPLHGGPPATTAPTLEVRGEVHRLLQRMVDRGKADGSIRADATPRDIVMFGALLAQPLPTMPNWDDTCRRLKSVYLDGLAARSTDDR